ncbi:hypothetical protein JCM8097_007316 [Rhodosporidiobolus ruineniae]
MDSNSERKRALPDDFDSITRAAPAPPVPSTSETSSALVTAQAGAGIEAVTAAQAWADELQERVETVRSLTEEGGGEGSVLLSFDEAQRLVNTLKGTVQSFLESPATRGDILALLNTISRATSSSTAAASPARRSSRSSRDFLAHFRRQLSDSAEPAKPSVAGTLPFDVIRLILGHLCDIYVEDNDSETLFGSTGGIYRWWRELKSLAAVSSSWKEACHIVYRSQLHIVDVKALPAHNKTLQKKPHRAEALRALSIRSYDFEHSFSRSNEDAGFAIPEIIERSTKLRSLALSADRMGNYTSGANPFRNRRQRFETLTGGINLPSVISTGLPALRTLVYGAPISLTDVLNFATEIPTLQSLDVLGDVDHSVAPSGPIKPAVPSLHRLWLPTTALSSSDLETLLAGPELLDDALRPRITALALTFDAEQFYAPVPPADEAVLDEMSRLGVLFRRIGSALTELHLSTPAADHPDVSRQLGWLGGGGQFALTIAAVLPGGGGGGAGGGFGGIGGLGGAGQAQPGAGAQAQPRPQAQPAGAPQPAAAAAGGAAAPRGNLGQPGGGLATALRQGGLRQALGFGQRAGGGGGQGGAPAPGTAPAQPQPQPGAAGPLPLPGAAAGGPQPAGGAGPGGVNILNIPPPPPPAPFFEALLESTPNLEYLELFGRRYAEELVPLLQEMPLRHLALSVPVDEVRETVVEGLLGALEKGGWPTLRRLELSGRGGEWAPAERRKVKNAAEKRDKLVYRSTDMKG